MNDSAPDAMPNGDRPPPAPPKRPGIDADDSGDTRRVTVSRSAVGEGKFIRGANARALYGHVVVRVEPNGRGKGITIISEVSDSKVPERFIAGIEAGIRESLSFGIDGRPVVDVVIRIFDGSSNKHDSTEVAFKIAGIFAVKEAVKNAEPIIID